MDTKTREALLAVTAILTDLLNEPAKGSAKPKSTGKKASQPKAEEPSEFVTWLRDTAEQRHARKATNKALAADLDSKRAGWRGAANRQAIWDAAKAGRRLPVVK